MKTVLTWRRFLGRVLSGVGVVALAFLVNASPALGHDATFHAYEASLDHAEARLLAANPGLAAAVAELSTNTAVCRLTIKLVDAKTQHPLSGLVRVTREDGSVVQLAPLVNRGVKLRANHPGKEWFALIEPHTVAVPREALRVEAIAGLESERVSQTLDLRHQETAGVTLAAPRFAHPARKGWRSGNTHLHLRGMTRAQADEYLRTIPSADGVEILFVSYLTRKDADRDYISNTYTPAEMRALTGRGVRFGWGEEHRHNFGAGAWGFGHVMLLNLCRLIEPVSIGPGIMGEGHDFPPLRRAMDEARRSGATVVWCHNAFGFEDVPNWLAGRIHAHNIFDGGSYGGYADTYYRFLNVGLKVPFSTGTDWFIYDFSRVYARVDGPLTERSWLAALTAGRTFISNGPLLELSADGRDIGDTIRLNRERVVGVTGRATGRNDFQKVELIHNGAVIAEASSRAKDGHFEAELKFPLRVSAPGWIALRVAGGDPDADGATSPSVPSRGGETRNEMGERLFGHTSPIYFEFAGRGVFQPDAARALLADMEKAGCAVGDQGRFADAAQREEVLAIYREGIASLRRRLNE